MGLFYYLFSGIGVTVVLILSLIALFTLIVWAIIRNRDMVRIIALSVAGFLVVQLLSFTILLNDFPRPSAVDITPLFGLGNAHIENFEERVAALEETRYFIRKNAFAYNYDFQYWQKPSVTMTIYRMESAEEAYRNLLVAVGEKEAAEIERISDTVYVYRSKSIYWRGRGAAFDEDFSRICDTYFMVDDVLFILHERGRGDEIGSTTGEVIALLYGIFFSEPAA